MASQCKVPLSSGLLKLVTEHAEATGQTVAELVEAALYSYLDIADHPERKESLTALYINEPIITIVDGLLEGEQTVADALTHGDFGLGTLNFLDGEVRAGVNCLDSMREAFSWWVWGVGGEGRKVCRCVIIYTVYEVP
eukprot:jgi/Chrzof1/9462/Cz04g04010.t1